MSYSSSSSSIIAVLTALACAVGCSDDDASGGGQDGGPDGSIGVGDGDGNAPACITPDEGVPECWYSEPPPVNAVAELGTGFQDFEAMPDEVHLVCGQQQGFHVETHVRVDEIEPGDSSDILCPSNPHTRFVGYFEGSDEPVNEYAACGSRMAYEQTEDGYVLQRGLAVIFPNEYQEDLFGQTVRIVVEVFDAKGRYATDERTVMLLPPEGWTDESVCSQ